MRFAVELLVSHLGKAKVRDIAQQEGRNTLSLISQLSPNVRKYREGQKAGLSELVKLSKQALQATRKEGQRARNPDIIRLIHML